MSAKECMPTEGTQNDHGVNGVLVSGQLFDSTSSSSSSNGSTTSGSDLLCADTKIPLKLPCADTKPSPPLKPSSASPPAAGPFRYLRKVEHDNAGAVKRSMGLMKLRRQGSHPPAASKSFHGSFNQAAAVRELMTSLERLSIKEEREKEAQTALLAVEGGAMKDHESFNAATMKVELPLTAKIAAAMDAEGLVGVQEEILLQCSKHCKTRAALRRSFSDQCSPPPSSFKACKSRKRRPATSDDEGVRPKMHCKRRTRWIILRRLRSSRALLGNLWIKLRRVFSSSSRNNLQKQLLKVST